ncbi:hypothetical protein CDD83_5919 [Cordyceps sp. RAO-2017]|nr:hypothetical protein CDD83_5919 [Cordyceps sp. RAO-2017]
MAVPNDAAGSNDLRVRLAALLPKSHRFRFHHLSTPPSKTNALCSAPPNERPDRTFCEKHFLAVSVDASPAPTASPNDASWSTKPTLILALEIFIYTTAHTTTLFISKADSTGFLSLLNLPKGTPSPIREICVAFIRYLVEKRRRKGLQFVVSLFARAQDQYLFPGSIKHSGKHVLDDRGLVKWWCRILDQLLVSPHSGASAPSWKNVQGYLVVPGLEAVETRALIPRYSAQSSSWILGHPLERISHYSREFDWVPPRCLIPRFPDDPKSRFRDELDEEASNSGSMQNMGTWRSVKSLDMFWEVMGFRQECSSGRMTGFIWVVFDDEDSLQRAKSELDPPVPSTPTRKKAAPEVTPKTTPKKLVHLQGETAGTELIESCRGKKVGKTKVHKKTLRGSIKARQPRVKNVQRNYLTDRPVSSKYYFWPAPGRGERLVDKGDYKRIVELLLHLDFATLDKATGSSKRWIAEAGMGMLWGFEVTGTKGPPLHSESEQGGHRPVHVNNLSGFVKRKRADAADHESRLALEQDSSMGTRCLIEDETQRDVQTELVTKKPKT